MASSDNEGLGGCLGLLIYIGVSVTLGGYCFGYILETVFGKNVPWYADALGGLVLSSLAVPGAIICWILTLAGVATPFIH